MVDKRIKCEDEKGIKDFVTVHRKYHFNQIWFMNWCGIRKLLHHSFKFYADEKKTQNDLKTANI